MDQQQKIMELKELVAYYQDVIQNMPVPIIPSIVPNTILVPIAGYIFRNRFETVRTKVLDYADTHRDTEQVIFDFTGVTMQDIQSFDFNELALELSQLNSALKLMGLRSISVGFAPRFVREIVYAGIQVNLEVYRTFRSALQTLLDERESQLR